MIYILKDRIIRIEWTILKGTSHVREDFRRANVKVFLIGNTEKYYLEATAEDGILKFDIPQGLEEGTYGIEAIWVKNEGHLGMGNRSISRSKKERLFSITEFEEEATNLGDGEVVLKFTSSTATYGYDGLSSYELAVLRGEWTGTEGEWLKHQRYVSVLDGRGDSETDTMSQKSITEELEAHDEAIEANKKAIEENKKEFDEYTEETDDRLDDVEERLDYIPKESFLSSDPAAGFNTGDVIEEDCVADRAISDRFGRRIDEEYVTRESVKNYTQEVVDGSKLEIMPGSVVPESLSPAVKQMIEAGAGKPGSITNLPDEEDITVTDANTLQFKDKEYNPYNYSGMGRVYLRKHIVNGTNILTQHMINKPNTIYIIQYDYCLADQTIEIPENCVLQFEGGSLRNGELVGNKTIIKSSLTNIFKYSINLNGSWNNIFESAWLYEKEEGSGLFFSNFISNNDYVLEFSNGEYVFDSPIFINRFTYVNKVLKGKGKRFSILKFPYSKGIVLSGYGTAGNYQYSTIKDFSIESNNVCIDVSDTIRVAMNACIFENLYLFNKGNGICLNLLNKKTNGNAYHNYFRNITCKGRYGIANTHDPKNTFEEINTSTDDTYKMEALIYNASGVFKNINLLFGKAENFKHFILIDNEFSFPAIQIIIKDSNLESFEDIIVYSKNENVKISYAEYNTTFLSYKQGAPQQIYLLKAKSFTSIQCTHSKAGTALIPIYIGDRLNYSESLNSNVGVILNVDRRTEIVSKYDSSSRIFTYYPEDTNSLLYHKWDYYDVPNEDLTEDDKGHRYFSKESNKWIIWNGSEWENEDGTLISKTTII